MCNCSFLQNIGAWPGGLKSELFKQRSFVYGMTLAVGMAVLFELAVFIVDPNVHSLADGVWYAWVTMTHVGYGDAVPTSFIGRLLASVLILFGLGALALMTATFSTILMGQGFGEAGRERSEILSEIKRLHERLERLEAERRQGE